MINDQVTARNFGSIPADYALLAGRCCPVAEARRFIYSAAADSRHADLVSSGSGLAGIDAADLVSGHLKAPAGGHLFPGARNGISRACLIAP
jgi:hypothetical protein